eukprot:TRINITY_DN66812_c0_g1_i1.p1 TRINITY_DN66812_c0_g1~~TRINITY_DN66812_c0_g1_i1.p1  ORF type:complete len:100 (-),score=51.11 TRINITY_DN66812_c0_g1_i1:268-534(-)
MEEVVEVMGVKEEVVAKDMEEVVVVMVEIEGALTSVVGVVEEVEEEAMVDKTMTEEVEDTTEVVEEVVVVVEVTTLLATRGIVIDWTN